MTARLVTVRCRHCRVKTTMDLNDSDYSDYQNALELGIHAGDWASYWRFMDDVNAECYSHEGLSMVKQT